MSSSNTFRFNTCTTIKWDMKGQIYCKQTSNRLVRRSIKPPFVYRINRYHFTTVNNQLDNTHMTRHAPVFFCQHRCRTGGSLFLLCLLNNECFSQKNTIHSKSALHQKQPNNADVDTVFRCVRGECLSANRYQSCQTPSIIARSVSLSGPLSEMQCSTSSVHPESRSDLPQQGQ